MSVLQTLNIDFEAADKRGSLVQLVHSGYTQVNVLRTRKGQERGGHYHEGSNEVFYVIDGMVTVNAFSNTERETKTYRKGDFFLIPAGTVHSMYFPEDTVMVGMYDVPVEKEDGSKDIIPYFYEAGNEQTR